MSHEAIALDPTGLIGHNRPPAVTDQEVMDLVKRRDELVAAFNVVARDIDSEVHAQKRVEYCKMLNVFIDRVEELRKKAKEPSMLEGRQIDGCFHAISEPIVRIAAAAREPLAAFMVHEKLKQIRTELGALATLSDRETFQINPRTVDLDALRPYLDAAHIEKAVRAFMKAGGKKLRGVKIIKLQAVVVR